MENYFRQGRLQGTTVKYGDTVQLKHILSGKYVDVISTETSVTESSKLLVQFIYCKIDFTLEFFLFHYAKGKILMK